jgi:hypothetical protein
VVKSGGVRSGRRESAAGCEGGRSAVLIESSSGSQQGDSEKEDSGGEGDLMGEFHMDDSWFQRLDAQPGGTCAKSEKTFRAGIQDTKKAPAGMLPGW